LRGIVFIVMFVYVVI